MKKHLLFFFSLCILYGSVGAQGIYSDTTLDSTTFTYSMTDSLNHYLRETHLIIDTAGTTLWQIGNTLKPAFSNDTVESRGIMTDTTHPYPRNANDFFVLKMDTVISNFIVDFWHHYQTDSFHAGGIVEFSFDTGATWLNIADCPEINIQNFYSASDTIFSGSPAFTGNSNGQQLSRFQFINCVGERRTGTSCGNVSFDFGYHSPPIYFRFRFASDSTTDSLSGWIIDSIRVENPGCFPGLVRAVSVTKMLHVFPIPSFDGIFNFPEMYDAQLYTIDIYNSLGTKIITKPYTQTLNLGAFPGGLYYYRVYNGSDYYSGILISY